MPKCLTFDAEKIANALRVRFPLLEEKILQELVATASHIVDHLWHGREARIAAHGENWRPLDSFAEIIALSFNMESMNQSGSASSTISIVSEAIHSVYCQGQDPDALPAGMAPPPSGRN